MAGQRVRDRDVESFLTWARNYTEIDSYKKLPNTTGRKWLIEIPNVEPVTASGSRPSWTEGRVVPRSFVLTSREAIAFGYGLAIAGARPETRAVFAAREWNW